MIEGQARRRAAGTSLGRWVLWTVAPVGLAAVTGIVAFSLARDRSEPPGALRPMAGTGLPVPQLPLPATGLSGTVRGEGSEPAGSAPAGTEDAEDAEDTIPGGAPSDSPAGPAAAPAAPTTPEPAADNSLTTEGGCGLLAAPEIAGVTGQAIDRATVQGGGCTWSRAGAPVVWLSVESSGEESDPRALFAARRQVEGGAGAPGVGIGDDSFVSPRDGTVWWLQDGNVYGLTASGGGARRLASTVAQRVG